MAKKTSKQESWNPNPTGKGGFADHPELRHNGRWNKDQSISYQYQRMIRMTVKEFKEWMKANPERERTVAQELAYQAVVNARKELNYLRELTDRTEGKPVAHTEISGVNGEAIKIAESDPRVIETLIKTAELLKSKVPNTDGQQNDTG